VARAEAVSRAKTELVTETENVEEQLAALEKADEIERLLKEMKAKRSGN
jgi:hypothetical protein